MAKLITKWTKKVISLEIFKMQLNFTEPEIWNFSMEKKSNHHPKRLFVHERIAYKVTLDNILSPFLSYRELMTKMNKLETAQVGAPLKAKEEQKYLKASKNVE